MSSGFSSLPIQRLCSHHVVDKFDCGDEAFNVILTEYHRHVDDSYHDVTVLSLVKDVRVLGYIAYSDIYLKSSGESEMRRMFLVPALAVTLKSQGNGAAAGRLIDAAFDALKRRQSAGHIYHGILCIPHTSEGLGKLLGRMGFGPLGSDSFFWSKPIVSQ